MEIIYSSLRESVLVSQGSNNHKFLLDGTAIGVFDSKMSDGRIGPKISMLSGDFIRQFKLPPHQQKFYCYTSSSNQSIYDEANYTSLQNIFEILSTLKEIELSLFEEYLNCIGNAFAVTQGRVVITMLYTLKAKGYS